MSGAPEGNRARMAWRSLILCALLGAALGVPQAGADIPGAFVGFAAATGGRASFVVPGQFAVEEIIDGGGPVSQSRLDASGGESFAALPYPGGNAVAYQGLFAVATGISSPFAYPAYVSATSPGAPSQELSDPSGTYRLLATAEPSRSTGLARFRPGAEDGFASGGEGTTSVVAEGERVVSSAESITETVSVGGGVLRITSVRSRSTTTYVTGTPKTETSLVVDGLRVGDLSLGVGPEGFVVLGQPVPFSAADVNGLIDTILGPSGIKLRFAEAREIVGGAQAAALEITTTSPPGPNGATGTVTIRLGGATSGINVGEAALPPADLDVVVPPAPPSPAPAAPVYDAGPDAGRPVAVVPATPAPPLRTSVAASLGFTSVLPAGTGAAGVDTSTVAAPPASDGAAAATGRFAAAQPMVQPSKVSSVRTVYGFIGAAVAAMFLVGMAWSGRGDRAWRSA